MKRVVLMVIVLSLAWTSAIVGAPDYLLKDNGSGPPSGSENSMVYQNYNLLEIEDSSGGNTQVRIMADDTNSRDPSIFLMTSTQALTEGFLIKYDNSEDETYFDSYLNGTSTDAAIYFRTAVASSAVEAMKITHGGDIEIPTGTLKMTSDNIILNGNNITNDGDNGDGLYVDDNGNIAIGANWLNSDGDENEGIIIDSSGKVGIKKAEPSYALDVTGSMELSGTLYGGAAWIDGEMSAATVVDRTPYPENLQIAYESVMTMERLPEGEYNPDNIEDQLDHSTLHPFVAAIDGDGVIYGRNLSATVSAQNEVLKDLVDRVETLESLLESCVPQESSQ